MASLFTKVELYLIANSKTWSAEIDNIELQNDGSGSYIKTWNVSGVTKPTDSQIASYESAGNTAETLSGVLNKRKTEYLTWQEQLDKLYHDIDDGKLDKTGSWYTHIKAVKDANSKD
tara:strand:+ start:171 stop:521 length:351 start_codon:yes stop_codon:yes gene_type:complete